MAEVIHHTKGFCFACSEFAVELGGAASYVVHEGESQFGCGLDDWVGGVGDANTAFATCMEVNIIETHTEVRHQFEVGCRHNHLACYGLIEGTY
jgi:hypothetical protein